MALQKQAPKFVQVVENIAPPTWTLYLKIVHEGCSHCLAGISAIKVEERSDAYLWNAVLPSGVVLVAPSCLADWNHVQYQQIHACQASCNRQSKISSNFTQSSRSDKL